MWFPASILLLLSTFVALIKCQAGYTEPSAGYFSIIVTIPQSTSLLDNGDVEFTIQTAADKGWVAVGIGEQMLGSLILVVYPGAGNNVTVSPRLGKGEVLPEFYPQTNIVMREGSGIVSSQMKAIFTCQNCKRWLGGSLDVNSDSQNWIWAVNPNDVLKTNSYSATLTQHSDSGYGSFQMDMTSAVVADAEASAPAALPFIGGGASATSGTSSTIVNPVQAQKNKLIIAHGVVMGIVFVVLFPFGAIIIRMLRLIIRQSFYIHVFVQLSSFVLAIAGMVLGVRSSDLTHSHFMYGHQFLGVIVMVFLLIQVVLGGTHHMIFKARGRTWVTETHVWFGRVCILGGVVNGGLGLPLAKATMPAKAVYSGLAALIAIIWILGFAGIKFWEHKMNLEGKEDDDFATPDYKVGGSIEMKDQYPMAAEEVAPVDYNKHQSVYLPANNVYNPRMSALWTPEQYDASREYPKQPHSPPTMFSGVAESPPLKQKPFSVIDEEK